MKVQLMLNKKRFAKKPEKWEILKLQKSVLQEEIEIEELAELLSNGCTFKPALLNGTKSDDWISQQVFALDFDEGTTIEEELKRCEKLNILPCFGYTSFRHTEEKHKFRLVFASDNIITDRLLRNKLQITLINTFSNSDKVTKDCTRMFFGGRKLIYKNLDNRIDINDVLDRFYKEEYEGDCVIKKSKSVKEVRKTGDCGEGVNGVQDIKDINITSLSCTPKSHVTESYNIKAISEQDTEYLRNKFNNEKIIFESFNEFKEHIIKMDLSEILEIKYPESFKCLFHKDNNPSASIFINENGHYIYKCHSSKCGRAFNIIGVIEVLGRFKTRPKTYSFIKEIFNLEIKETEWQEEQKKMLNENIRQILTSELDDNCPIAMKNVKNITRYLEMLHNIATQNIYSEELTDKHGNLLFFTSLDFIRKAMRLSPNSLNKISQKLVVLAYHNLIRKVDDSEVPDKYFKKSKHLSIDKNNKYKSHVSWFSIPSYTYNQYPKIEERGIQWQENKYTMKGVSREMFYRTEGLDVANELYPQYKKVTEDGEVVDRTTTEESDTRTDHIVRAIIALISIKGYATEKDIVDLIKHNHNYKVVEVQIKKSLKEIMDSYDFVRVKCNKQLKEKYDMDSKGYPYIIIKNEE